MRTHTVGLVLVAIVISSGTAWGGGKGLSNNVRKNVRSKIQQDIFQAKNLAPAAALALLGPLLRHQSDNRAIRTRLPKGTRSKVIKVYREKFLEALEASINEGQTTMNKLAKSSFASGERPSSKEISERVDAIEQLLYKTHIPGRSFRHSKRVQDLKKIADQLTDTLTAPIFQRDYPR